MQLKNLRHRDAAEKVIGRSTKQSKPWIEDKTWKKVKERKDVKLKMEGAKAEMEGGV